MKFEHKVDPVVFDRLEGIVDKLCAVFNRVLNLLKKGKIVLSWETDDES